MWQREGEHENDVGVICSMSYESNNQSSRLKKLEKKI
jgi:hypothetical protein